MGSMPSWRQRFRTGVLLIAMTCYLSKLDATTLDLTATVVRDGRAVLDARDLQTGGLERADGGRAAASGTLDEDGDLLEAVLHRHLGGLLGGHLRRERRGLAGALEPNRTCGLPGNDVSCLLYTSSEAKDICF